MQISSPPILIRGGLNLVTPALAAPPGMSVACSNYEMDARGAARLGGYERADGRARPSEASYWVLDFQTGTAAITTGQTVTGLTSGATGVALRDATVSTGSYGGGDAVGYLVLGFVSGTFQNGEALQVGGITKSLAVDSADENSANTNDDNKAFTKLAANAQRALITAVPGSGAVRGVWTLNGSLYAIRDNVGATAGVMHKATAGGWSAQSLGSYLRFDAGSAEFVEGGVVTGGTSGATATVRRVVLLSGAWSGTAAGFLVLSGVVGVFQNNEAITGSSGSATVDGTITANALPAGGKYHFTNENFYGAGFSERMYGANGVGRAFEWDGTYFTPIFTGLSDALDKPKRVAAFSNHLFLFFEGGYYVWSEIGTPTAFQSTLGAGDNSFGSDVSDVLDTVSTALIVVGAKRVGFITGTDADNFRLDFVSREAGGEAWTLQDAGQPIYFDKAGLRRLQTTQEFGNWRMGTITQLIEPLIKDKQRQGAAATCSIVARRRDIYRIFFDDLSAISVYFGREFPECMPLELPVEFNCACTGTLSGENMECQFVGGADGYVYELERGTSFDGEGITAFNRLAWNSQGEVTTEKRYNSLRLECDAGAGAVLNVSCDFEYGNPDFEPAVETLSVSAGGGFWNQSNWNEFYWSTQAVGVAFAYIDGIGNNISPVIISDDIDDEPPHVLSAIIVNYSRRGMKRGA